MSINEEAFDGRYGLVGFAGVTEIKCKRCKKSLKAIMSLEGQFKLETFLISPGIEYLRDAYLIPSNNKEVTIDGHVVIEGKGLIKCPECFYVNEVSQVCAKNEKENTYKNFD